MSNNKRKFQRTNCRLSVYVESDAISYSKPYKTSNISLDGLLVSDLFAVPQNKTCQLLIQDHYGNNVKLSATVTQQCEAGTIFKFQSLKEKQKHELKNIMNPHWDGKDYLDGTLMLLRYTKKASKLSDCLFATSLLAMYPPSHL